MHTAEEELTKSVHEFCETRKNVYPVIRHNEASCRGTKQDGNYCKYFYRAFSSSSDAKRSVEKEARIVFIHITETFYETIHCDIMSK